MAAYDKLDWHLEGAAAAGQPERNAFTHIGFYLVWLIRRDLVDATYFEADRLEAVKRGAVHGGDLIRDVDEKLVSTYLAPEGRAFTAARYDDYLERYAQAFPDDGDYSIVDTPENYARVEPGLDDLFRAWIASGRPTPNVPDAEAEALAGWESWQASLAAAPPAADPDE